MRLKNKKREKEMWHFPKSFTMQTNMCKLIILQRIIFKKSVIGNYRVDVTQFEANDMYWN